MTKKRDLERDYTVYALVNRSNKTFFVGKVISEDTSKILRRHKRGNFTNTKDWINDSVEMFYLERIYGTRVSVFKNEILWTRFFLDKGFTYSTDNSRMEESAMYISEEFKKEYYDVLFKNYDVLNNEESLSNKGLTPNYDVLINNYDVLNNSYDVLNEVNQPINIFDKEFQKQIIEAGINKRNDLFKSIYFDLTEEEVRKVEAKVEDSGLSFPQFFKINGLNSKAMQRIDASEMMTLAKETQELRVQIMNLVLSEFDGKEEVRAEIRRISSNLEELLEEYKEINQSFINQLKKNKEDDL